MILNNSNYITLEMLEKALEKNNEIMGKKLQVVVETAVNGAVDSLAVIVKENFEKVDGRLDKIETKIDVLDKRVDKVETKLGGLNSKVNGVNNRLDYHAETYLTKAAAKKAGLAC